MKKQVLKGLAVLVAFGSLACSSERPDNTKKRPDDTKAVRQPLAGANGNLTFRVTGVLADTSAWNQGLITINMGSSWDSGGAERIFQCGSAVVSPLACALAPGAFEADVFHPFPEHFEDQFSPSTPRHFIKTKTADLADETASIDVQLQFSPSNAGDYFINSTAQFTVDIDLATGATEPRLPSGAACGFRHNGEIIGCEGDHGCGGPPPLRPECNQECVLLALGWELCYEVEMPISCGGENSACRSVGTRVHRGGMIVDDCTPAPAIDLSKASCPVIPASTFTTEGLVDTDSDGIPDLWETNGFDANCDGDVTDDDDLPFHIWGANPQHKDLFVEFDWMTGEEPRRGAIEAMKDAFANAPIDAGGTSNPDGLPGINLFVDTGLLVDPTASEDGAGPGTCGDTLENAMAPQPADGADGNDPECLVGDNLQGGNEMAVQNFSRVDARFKAAKCLNFNPIRERFFRYGISARRGCRDPLATEDGRGPGSCQNVTATGIPMDDSDDDQDAGDLDCQAGGSGFEDGSTDPNSCTDSKNNGADGMANCGDPDCNYDPGADEGSGPGTCSNGIDDDGDNKIDVADEDHCHYVNGQTDLVTGFVDHSHWGTTIMHELGHMLGLDHGGPYRIDGVEVVGHAQDRKPNQLSIMQNRNLPGIRLRTSEDGSLVANSCFDGIDNGGDGAGDIWDSDCQVGHDVWGDPLGRSDGIRDGVLLDYSPPRRTDGSRVQLPDLNEQTLSENLALDFFDSTNLFSYVGYVPTRLEDNKNTCGDGVDNGHGDGFDNSDSDCLIFLTTGGTVFVAGLPEDNVTSCNDGGIDNGTTGPMPLPADGADEGDTDCRLVFINAVDGDNDGDGNPDSPAVDWLRDGMLNLPTVAVDINGDADLRAVWNPEEILRGANEWRNIKIRTPGLGGGQAFQVVHEATIQQVEAQLRHERGTDLGISFDELPTGIGVGLPVSVRVVVTNLGPRPAAEYTAVLRLPPGVTLDDPSCSQVGSRVECPRTNLGVRAADVFTVVIRIGTNPVSAVRTLAAEVEVVGAENLNAGNNLFGRLLVEPSAGCDPQAPFEAPVAAFTGSMDADGLTFSANGQTAYISGAGPGGRDIYVATLQPNGTFSAPELVTELNTQYIERAPSLSPDGKLYFTKQGSSGLDICRGTAPGFTDVTVLGPPISSSDQEEEDPFWWGNNTLYFGSQSGSADLWVTTWSGTTFSTPTLVEGESVNTGAFWEFRPVLSPDGLTLYFGSNRYGIGFDRSGDVYMARRTSLGAPFDDFANLYGLNSTAVDYPVTVSANGCTLYFASQEESALTGGTTYRLYQATRGTSTPTQVTLRLNILGQGSVTTPPFNCGPGNTGTCSASAPPDTTSTIFATSPAQWTGSCTGNGGTPSDDGIVVYSQNAVCTIKFPGASLVGPGGLCSLSLDCQQGLRCVNNTCGS